MLRTCIYDCKHPRAKAIADRIAADASCNFRGWSAELDAPFASRTVYASIHDDQGPEEDFQSALRIVLRAYRGVKGRLPFETIPIIHVPPSDELSMEVRGFLIRNRRAAYPLLRDMTAWILQLGIENAYWIFNPTNETMANIVVAVMGFRVLRGQEVAYDGITHDNIHILQQVAHADQFAMFGALDRLENLLACARLRC